MSLQIVAADIHLRNERSLVVHADMVQTRDHSFVIVVARQFEILISLPVLGIFVVNGLVHIVVAKIFRV